MEAGETCCSVCAGEGLPGLDRTRQELLAEGSAKPSEIAKALASEFGIAKGVAYDIVQELKDSFE